MTAPEPTVFKPFFEAWMDTPPQHRGQYVWHVNADVLNRALKEGHTGLLVGDGPLLLFGRPIHADSVVEGIHLVDPATLTTVS